jgi:hypothetical protein
LNLAFVAKPANRDREKWKGFAIINADENMMQNMESATQLQESLLSVMETKARLPVRQTVITFPINV